MHSVEEWLRARKRPREQSRVDLEVRPLPNPHPPREELQLRKPYVSVESPWSKHKKEQDTEVTKSIAARAVPN